jgi:hypothetical protein
LGLERGCQLSPKNVQNVKEWDRGRENRENPGEGHVVVDKGLILDPEPDEEEEAQADDGGPEEQEQDDEESEGEEDLSDVQQDIVDRIRQLSGVPTAAIQELSNDAVLDD